MQPRPRPHSPCPSHWLGGFLAHVRLDCRVDLSTGWAPYPFTLHGATAGLHGVHGRTCAICSSFSCSSFLPSFRGKALTFGRQCQRLGEKACARQIPSGHREHPPQLHLLYVFPVSSAERETGREAFLGMELNTDQVKSGQWTLLALSFVMLLAVLLLGRRLYTLEKTSLTQDTSTQDTRSQGTQSQSPRSQDANAIEPASKTYFLGIAMEPHQVVKRQWMLLGLCLFLMLCSIGLIIRIFTQHNRKPPWMRDEWGSWD